MSAGSLVGKRVRFVFSREPDAYSSLEPGTLGTVTFGPDALGTLHVKWDNGSTLGLVRNVDLYEVVPDFEGTVELELFHDEHGDAYTCKALLERADVTRRLAEAFDIPLVDGLEIGSDKALAVVFSIVRGIVIEYLDGGAQLVENCTCGEHHRRDDRYEALLGKAGWGVRDRATGEWLSDGYDTEREAWGAANDADRERDGFEFDDAPYDADRPPGTSGSWGEA